MLFEIIMKLTREWLWNPCLLFLQALLRAVLARKGGGLIILLDFHEINVEMDEDFPLIWLSFKVRSEIILFFFFSFLSTSWLVFYSSRSRYSNEGIINFLFFFFLEIIEENSCWKDLKGINLCSRSMTDNGNFRHFRGKKDWNYSFHGKMADSFVCIKDSCRSYLLKDQKIIEFT